MVHRAEVPTAADVPDTSRGAVERWWTRAGLVLMALVVVAGATGLLGTRTATKRASAGDKVLMVTYPAISRSGQPAQMHVRVTSGSGFDGPLRISLCDDLFDDLDVTGVRPSHTGCEVAGHNRRPAIAGHLSRARPTRGRLPA